MRAPLSSPPGILVPEDLTGAALDTVLVGAGLVQRRPPARRGRLAARPNVVLANVARGGETRLVEDLRAIGVVERGAISLEHPESHLSAASARAAERAPGAPGEAVVWEEVEAVTSRPSRSTGPSSCSWRWRR